MKQGNKKKNKKKQMLEKLGRTRTMKKINENHMATNVSMY